MMMEHLIKMPVVAPGHHAAGEGAAKLGVAGEVLARKPQSVVVLGHDLGGQDQRYIHSGTEHVGQEGGADGVAGQAAGAVDALLEGTGDDGEDADLLQQTAEAQAEDDDGHGTQHGLHAATAQDVVDEIDA